jgi:hypothetical protein
LDGTLIASRSMTSDVARSYRELNATYRATNKGRIPGDS